MIPLLYWGGGGGCEVQIVPSGRLLTVKLQNAVVAESRDIANPLTLQAHVFIPPKIRFQTDTFRDASLIVVT